MLLTVFDRYNQKRTDLSPNNGTQVKEIQADNILTLSFTLYEHVALDVNDYVDYMGERYWLMEKYRPKQKSTVEWEYNVKLYGIESLIKRFLVLKTVDGEDEPVFTLTAPPREHVAMIVQCINDGMGDITDFKVGTIEGTENITIDYEGKYCDEALKEIAEKVGTEWWAEGQTFNICRCEHGEEITLGYGKGLTEIDNDTADNAKFYTRLFPIGSSKNIDRNKYGYSRLQLPNKARYVDVNTDKYGIIHHYEASAFTDIYPRRVGIVSSVRSEEVTGEDGTPFKIYYFRDDSLNFDPNEYELSQLVKRVSFQEGSELAGQGNEEDGNYFFEVNYNSDTREFEIITIWPYDNDLQLPNDTLIPKAGDKYILWNIAMPSEYYALAEEEFQIAVEKYNEQHAIDVSRYKAPTDHVYIEDNNIDLFVGRRVRLESAKYFPELGYRKSRITKITRKVNMPSQMDIEISDALSTGSLTKIGNDITDVKNYTKGIASSISLPDIIKSWDNTLPTDNNIFSARRIVKQFADKSKDEIIEGIWQFFNGLKSHNFTSGTLGEGWWLGSESGRSYMEVDKLYVRMKAIFDSLEIKHIEHVGGEFLLTPAGAKITAVGETIAGVISFDAIEEINTTSFASDETITPNRIIYVPSLHLFVGEVFTSGVIKPTYYLNFKGSKNYGQVGSAYKCDNDYYYYEGSSLTLTESRNAFRCYIKTSDEDMAVTNTFKYADLVMCKTFNVDAERQRYYWRKCVGVGTDYIDLSKDQCDTSVENDEPMPQDSIVTVGHPSDTDRQNAILISSYGEFAPSIILYKGIDTFSLDGKAEIQISPKGNKFKGEFIVKTADGQEYSLVEFLNDKISLSINTSLYSEECVVNPYPDVRGETTEYTIDLNDNCLAWQQGDKILVEIGMRCRNTGDLTVRLFGEEATAGVIAGHAWSQELYDPSGNDINTVLTAELEVLAPVVRNNEWNYAYFLFQVIGSDFDISSVSVRRKSMQERLVRTGIDIEEGVITLDAETTQIQDNGKAIAVFTTNSEGKAVIKTELIDAEQLDVTKLKTKPQNRPHVSIEGDAIQIYDAEGNVKIKLHGGCLGGASSTGNSQTEYDAVRNELEKDTRLFVQELTPTALIVENSNTLYQFTPIQVSATLNLRVPDTITEFIPFLNHVELTLVRYCKKGNDATFDIDDADDNTILGRFRTEWTGTEAIEKHIQTSFYIDNTTLAVGSYKLVLEYRSNTPYNNGVLLTKGLENSRIFITASPIISLQEIGSDGFNYQFGEATKYIKATEDGFEVRNGAYGIRITGNGAEYTTDGFHSVYAFGTSATPNIAYPNIQAMASVDESTGTPNVQVKKSGADSNPTFTFEFSGLKGTAGVKGEKGDKGDPGEKGETGTSITEIVTTYQSSASGTDVPTGEWSVNPTVEKGSYLWSRMEIKLSSNVSRYHYSVAYHGTDANVVATPIFGEIVEYKAGSIIQPTIYWNRAVSTTIDKIVYLVQERLFAARSGQDTYFVRFNISGGMTHDDYQTIDIDSETAAIHQNKTFVRVNTDELYIYNNVMGLKRVNERLKIQ